MLQPAYLPSLDGLRGVSIIIVLIFHILLVSGYAAFNGGFGVEIFFVISGFIITTLLLKEKFKKQDISLRKFYIRRFLKIIPVAYLYLLVITLLNFYYKYVKPTDILSAALFIKNTNIIPTGLEKVTGHFWSLSVEEQFYLFFPFILKKSIRAYVMVILLLLTIIPGLLYFDNRSQGIFSAEGMHNFVDLFRFITPILIGSLCAILVFKGVIAKNIYPKTLVTNLLVMGLAYVLYQDPVFGYYNYYHTFFSSGLVALLIVNNISHSNDLFFKFLNSKVLVTIGLASYSIYVWQQLFLLQTPWSHAFKYSGSIWLNLVALLIISFCSYYFVERKLAVFKKRFK